MSDSIIKLIPADPQYVPNVFAQDRVIDFLKSLLPSPDPESTISTRTTGQIEFVDQGENFERIICPVCGLEIPIDWWEDVMDKARAREFTDLGITTPCCHAATSLNDLHYEWPAGFSRFTIELFEPFTLDSKGVWQMLVLNEDQIERLQEILGCDIKVIYAHY